MDSTAFHELIAQVRGTRTALAEAEQKVTAVKGELAQQEHGLRCHLDEGDKTLTKACLRLAASRTAKPKVRCWPDPGMMKPGRDHFDTPI
jgi:hypothetical protein